MFQVSYIILKNPKFYLVSFADSVLFHLGKCFQVATKDSLNLES